MTRAQFLCICTAISLFGFSINVQAVLIDSFTTAQVNNTEVIAGEAIGGVRNISTLIGSASVAGGEFICDGFVTVLGVCDITYDGVLDGSSTSPGNINGIDLSTGESELSINVTSITGTFTVNIEARDTIGVLCQLSVTPITTTGAHTMPFVPSGNGADCAAVLGDLDRLSFGVFTSDGGVINFNISESTPVELMHFEID